MLTEFVKILSIREQQKGFQAVFVHSCSYVSLDQLSLLNQRSSFASVTGAVKSSLYALFVRGKADLNFEENSAVS